MLTKILKAITVIVIGGSIVPSLEVRAQDAALKTNLFYDATATVSLGLEFSLAPGWTMDVLGNLNAWEFREGRKWKHVLVQPEARYWFGGTFSGYFFGMHVHGGTFNVGNVRTPMGLFGDPGPRQHEGWFYGTGISFGRQWVLSDRWNLELSVGAGYVGSDYRIYECIECGSFLGRAHDDYFGITKATLSLVLIIF